MTKYIGGDLISVNCMRDGFLNYVLLQLIGCMKKQVIRLEITSITSLFHLGKLVSLLFMCNEALYKLWPCSTISVVVPTGRYA